jgi:hypothetical protein
MDYEMRRKGGTGGRRKGGPGERGDFLSNLVLEEKE